VFVVFSRSTLRAARRGFAVAILAATPAHAQPRGGTRAPGANLQIHVRGVAELHAVASVSGGNITVHGELIDDAGTPIAGARIQLSATSGDDARAPLRIGPLRPCEDSGGRPAPRGGPDDLETDERGGFCAVGSQPGSSASKLTVTLRFKGSSLHDATEVSVPVDPAEDHLQRTVLRFEPAPETIDLDRETVTITAALRVDRAEAARALPSAAGSAQRANLTLVLTDERGAHVAEAATGGDGRARFEVKTEALAGPGTGELTVRFAGNAVLSKAVWSQPIVRRAEAHLALAHPPARVDPEDGVPLDLDVATARGPLSGGVVEVWRLAALGAAEGPAGERLAPKATPILGAANVDEGGHAHVVAVFSAGGASHAPLALRYVPAAPWYRPGPELHIDAPLAGPGVGRSLLLAIVVIAAAVWVVVGWRRAPRPPVAPGIEASRAPPSGRAGVHVLGSPPDLAGWRGTVADAHDASPVAGARLSIVAPSFQGDGVVARAVADERGAFALEGSYRSDARLVVESAEHSTYEQALPPPSVLAVALVTRRRTLLDRLVRWARQKGAPFDGAPEPTPGHVRRVAARGSAEEVEAWATRVEQAAYGQSPVDAGVEREVREAEPRGFR
jgi:hypothetical protein